MNDSSVSFQTLMRFFVVAIPRSAWGDIRRLVTLAWAVVGLCLSKVVNLSSWGESVESKATHAASRARRFQRWLDNAKIDVPTIYTSLLKVALKGWDRNPRVCGARHFGYQRNPFRFGASFAYLSWAGYPSRMAGVGA
jgi:hypothetical protein